MKCANSKGFDQTARADQRFSRSHMRQVPFFCMQSCRESSIKLAKGWYK